MGVLSTLLWTPALGALLLALIPQQKLYLVRPLALLFTGITLLLSCILVFNYNNADASLQFSEYFLLNPKFGSSYALGVDGVSLPMVRMRTGPMSV